MSRINTAPELLSEIDATIGRSALDPKSSRLNTQMSHIARMGLFARPTRFYFILDDIGWYDNERLNRNCQTTSLPGRAFQTQPLKIYGPPKEFIYETNYQNELQMTFRIGEDMFERDFFEQWMNKAMSYSSSDITYPDSYMTSMRIYQLDRTDNKLYCSELYNVFCKAVSDIELSADATDQVETVNITLGYSEYNVIGYVQGKTRPEPKAKTEETRKPIYPGNKQQIFEQLQTTLNPEAQRAQEFLNSLPI